MIENPETTNGKSYYEWDMNRQGLSWKSQLKFRLKRQQKFTRAKTLGWFYESKQIKGRITAYKDVISYKPRTKIKATTAEFVQENRFVENAIDRKNMKIASQAMNVVAKYGLQPSEVESAAYAAFRKKSFASGRIESNQNED